MLHRAHRLGRFVNQMGKASVSIAIRNSSTKPLVIVEHNQGVVSQGSLSAVTAASAIGGEISVLIVGQDIGEAAKHASTIKGVSTVCTVDHPTPVSAEAMSDIVKEVAKDYSHILAPSTNVGKNFIPRVAALMDCAPLTDILSVVNHETFTRPFYAGNAIATVKMNSPIKFVLVRPTAFDKAEIDPSAAAPISAISCSSVASGLSTFVSENTVKSERPDLATASIVVSGGRGMKSKENFDMLTALADKMGGAVGASRAAVDAGFAPNDYQVGQTGKQVAPDLYVAVGISGAIQHLSGMKDSKTIVAINKDKEAPIFQVSDYGLCEDLFKAVPELSSKL